jgi:hypothetical protein
MARPRTAMREIREVLRLAHPGGLSERQVAASVRIAPSAAGMTDSPTCRRQRRRDRSARGQGFR